MVITRERQMRPQVCTWLSGQGFIPVFEVHLACFGASDIVAGKFAEGLLTDIIAVELKLDDIAEVLRQATNNRYVVPWSYAAMPDATCERMRQATLQRFEEQGIGLLSVGERVRVFVPPKRFSEADEVRLAKLGKRLWRRRNEWHTRQAEFVR